MIQLFNVPHYTIDTSRFSNLLHDKVVREFEEKFADYVGAKYAVSFNSATSAIFLQFLNCTHTVQVPSIIPPVVLNALINAGCKIKFVDDVSWVGGDYCLHKYEADVEFVGQKIIDSAQKVERDQYRKAGCSQYDLMLFSFYPTKPVGSSDGGMFVSDDLGVIEHLREMSLNGMSYAENNWDRVQKHIGHKMYMNSISAYIALQNLEKLDEKKERLAAIRDQYNKMLGLNNTSDHLYRINVKNNRMFIDAMKQYGIMCGIHYEAAHKSSLFKPFHVLNSLYYFPLSEKEEKQTVSIPFHEGLTSSNLKYIVELIMSLDSL